MPKNFRSGDPRIHLRNGKTMNILIIGSGGREHALAWKLRQSPDCDKLFIAPGNGGTGTLGTNLSLSVTDFEGISKAVDTHSIDMMVVGPEEPLVKGLTDHLKSEFPDLMIIGTDSKGAMLEGSKEYAKKFMKQYGIPTAQAEVFDEKNIDEGYKFLSKLKPPYVLKADGLAAGKGVIITEDPEHAEDTLKSLILDKKFGEASATVLIEEFLAGIELSVFVLTDGKNYKILPEAKDYKRIGEDDTGPNTGGMGAVSPVIFADRIFMEKVEEKIIKPTIEGIQKEGFDYKGFIFIGLMNQGNEPYVIEYNVRMGDPETEVVMPRIKSDLLNLLMHTAKGTLDQADCEIEPFTASTVMLVSEGYPGSYEKGRKIEISSKEKGTVVFHAGTKMENDQLITSGGRVIAVTGLGKNMNEALNHSYEGASKIKWEGMNFRRDIGFDLKRLGQ